MKIYCWSRSGIGINIAEMEAGVTVEYWWMKAVFSIKLILYLRRIVRGVLSGHHMLCYVHVCMYAFMYSYIKIGLYSAYRLHLTEALLYDVVSCLVFNHPRSDSWSLQRHLLLSSVSLSSFSNDILAHFFHVVNPSHLSSPLLSYSRNSALYGLFLQRIPFFSHRMIEV